MLKDKSKGIERIKIYICIMLGILLSVSMAMSKLGEGNLEEGFLNLGEVCQIQMKDLQSEDESYRYDTDTGLFEIQADETMISFPVSSDVEKWKYLSIKLAKIDSLPMTWNIHFVDKDGDVLLGTTANMRLGENVMKQTIKGDVDTIRITISGHKGQSFVVEDMSLSQKYFSVETFMKTAIGYFCSYIVFIIVILMRKKMNWYGIIEMLQNFYVWIGDETGKRIANHINVKVRRSLVQIVFFLIFISMIVMNILIWNHNGNAIRYLVFGMGVLLVLVAILSWEKPLEKVNWRTPGFIAYGLLWGMICVSDILLHKDFSYVGYVMLLCGGFAMFVWQNTGRYHIVMLQMSQALQWTLWPVMIFCILCCQKETGAPYKGCFGSHEEMGIYALSLWIAFLTEINLLLHQKKLNFQRLVIAGIGSGVSALFLYYSETKVCMLAAGVVLILWLLYQIGRWKELMSCMKMLFPCSVVTLILAYALICVVVEGVKVIPSDLGMSQMWQHAIRTKEEMLPFIEGLNLLGHESTIIEEEIYLVPGNTFVQMAYRYGVFILMPYVLMLALSVYGAVRQSGFLRRGIVGAFLVLVLFANIETPFLQPLWLMMYLSMGLLFENKTKRIVREN